MSGAASELPSVLEAAAVLETILNTKLMVRVSVCSRASLVAALALIALSSSIISVAFAALSLIKPITYFAYSGLYFRDFGGSHVFANLEPNSS